MSNSPALLKGLIALTVIASVALLLILVLRPLLRRMGGPVLAYAAWLLLPLSLLAAVLPQPAVRTVVFNLPMPAATLKQATTLQTSPQLWQAADGWLLLWFIGVMAALFLMARQQWRFQRALGRLLPTDEPRVFRAVEAASARSGPLLMGLLRPRIVLPVDFESRYSATEQRLIRDHERLHLERGDLVAHAFAALLQALFWFNPLVYLAVARFRLDQELACDELVLRRHPQSRQDYANAILKTQLGAQGAPLACQWHSRHPVRERIVQLTRVRPARWRRSAAAGTLCGMALAASYGAWATEAADGSLAAPDLSGKARFKLAVSVGKEVFELSQTTKTSISADIAIEQGKRLVLFPGQSGALGCEFTFELLEVRPDNTVMMSLPLNCKDIGASRPRMLVRTGEPAKMQFGRREAGGTLYTLTAIVTPWPADVAWPQPLAAN